MRRSFWGDAGACVSSMLTVVVPAGTHVRLSGARPPIPRALHRLSPSGPGTPGVCQPFHLQTLAHAICC